MMQFIWMCIIGLVAGAIAKLIMPGKDPGGIIITVLLGIAGSLVAAGEGWLLIDALNAASGTRQLRIASKETCVSLLR